MGKRYGWRALTVTVVVIRAAGMLWCLASIVFAVRLSVSESPGAAQWRQPFVGLMVTGVFGWMGLLLTTTVWKVWTRQQLADEDIDADSVLSDPNLNGYLSDLLLLGGVAGFVSWEAYESNGSGQVWVLGVLILGLLVAGSSLAVARGDLRRARAVLWDLPASPKQKVDPFRWPSD